MADYGFPVNSDCIFCKIVAKELPSACVYEDERLFAFLDISPMAKGHTLIIPKGHYPTLLEMPSSLAGPIVRAMQLVAASLQDVMKCQGFNVLQNNFSAAGQMVFHTHWHIIPRFLNDGLHLWKSMSYSDTSEMQNIAASVKEQIENRIA